MKVPQGFKLVYNRLDHQAEWMFDGRVYVFQKHETQMLPEDAAFFLTDASIFSYDPAQATVKRALVLEDDENFEVPFEGKLPIELIDRSTDPEYLLQRGSDDGPRRTEYLKVPGGEGAGKPDPLLKKKS